jgi:hypothetical protein
VSQKSGLVSTSVTAPDGDKAISNSARHWSDCRHEINIVKGGFCITSQLTNPNFETEDDRRLRRDGM